MNLEEFDIGDAVRMRATFTVGTTPTDPSTITLHVTDPSANIATYTYGAAQLIKESTGVFYRDEIVDEAGEWHWRMVGTGTVDAVFQRRFAVRRTGA